MVTLESRSAKDDTRNARLSERGRVPSRPEPGRDVDAWVPAVDFDDDLYADVPCTD